MDHPLDVMFAKGALLLPSEADDADLRPAAQRRRDTGALYANLAWHVFGQPFAGIDSRTKRFVPPTENADDADQRRARQTDLRSPEERAEDVRCRYEAMRSLLRPGSLREWLVRMVAVHCRPISSLARSTSKREQFRRHLVEALDLVADTKAVRRAEEEIRTMWSMRRMAA